MNPAILLLIGACYAIGFWVVAARQPRIALLLIIALSPFQNDISGGGPVKFSPAEVNLLLTLPILMLKARRMHFGPTLVPALLYMGVCVFSTFGQWKSAALPSLVQIGLYTIVIVMVFASLAREEEDYRRAFDGLLFVACVFAVLVIGLRSSSIFGLQKNGVGSSLAAGFVVALELLLNAQEKKKKRAYSIACLLLAFSCLLTLSRGAWLAAVTGAMVLLLLRRRFGLMFKCVAMLAPVVAIGWLMLPQESRDYATGFSAEKNWNIKLRYESIEFAKQAFYSSPVQGLGLGLRKEYDATNIVLMTLAETGVPGLLTFFGLHLAVIVMVLKAQRRVPQRTLSFSLLSLALALVAGKFVHGLVDHYWSRGALTVVWASVGMAVRVGYDQKMARRRMLRQRAVELMERESVDEPAREEALAY